MTPEDHVLKLTLSPPAGGPMDLMRLCLFDWAVCAVAGQDEPVAAILAMECDAEGECSVVGGGKTVPTAAALINGAAGHALDYDDTHFAHIGHTSAVVMPAVLALAEEEEADLADVLDAALVGSEVAVRVGQWLGRAHYEIGFHQTATSGAIGAAMAAARLLGLSPPQARHALGLAATGASGLKGQFGTMGKPLNAGLAARCGVESAIWARAGMTSDAQGLSGAQGLGATHQGAGDLSAFDGTGWRVAAISHKFHACCHGLHAMLEALRDLPDGVTALEVHTHPRWMSVCNKPAPQTGLEAKFSYAQTAAMMLAGLDTGDTKCFTDAAAKDAKLAKWRDKVQVEADEALPETAARVVVTTATGAEERHHDLAQPMALIDRESRLKHKAHTVVGDDLAMSLWDAVQADATGPLMGVLRGR